MIREILENKVELEFVPANNEEHYELTPYNFSPKLARKITDSSHVDLGQGIVDLLNNLHAAKNRKAIHKEVEA